MPAPRGPSVIQGFAESTCAAKVDVIIMIPLTGDGKKMTLSPVLGNSFLDSIM
jgi:hypothetical protein